MKLSKIVAEKYGISVRAAKDSILHGKVSIDGTPRRKDTEAEGCDPVLSVVTHGDIEPKQYLISDCGDVVFFEKPLFMHSERQRPDDPLTMQDVAAAYSDDLELISRLDWSTDGVIAAVRKGVRITSQHKTYLAWVDGNFDRKIAMDNIIDADKRKKVRVTNERGGNMTIFFPVRQADGRTLVRAELEKATRHQLRVFLAHLGHPICGDSLYGGSGYERILLHCSCTVVNNISICSSENNEFSEIF